MCKFWENKLENLAIKHLIGAFELLPDVLFWIKDTEGRIIYANNVYIERVGLKTTGQIHGKTDKSFFPPHLARQYMNDDEKLLKGEIVTDRIEMNIVKEGEFGWFSTSKRPLYDDNNNIVGSYGVTRHYQKSNQALSPFHSIQLPIDFIRKNYHQQITLEQLAELTHVSISALERRFKKCLSKTPTRFIKEVRLENARLLLMEQDMPISEVAYQVGFSDHSYFTKEFKSFFGIHPTELREQIKNDLSHFDSHLS